MLMHTYLVGTTYYIGNSICTLQLLSIFQQEYSSKSGKYLLRCTDCLKNYMIRKKDSMHVVCLAHSICDLLYIIKIFSPYSFIWSEIKLDQTKFVLSLYLNNSLTFKRSTRGLNQNCIQKMCSKGFMQSSIFLLNCKLINFKQCFSVQFHCKELDRMLLFYFLIMTYFIELRI